MKEELPKDVKEVLAQLEAVADQSWAMAQEDEIFEILDKLRNRLNKQNGKTKEEAVVMLAVNIVFSEVVKRRIERGI